MTKSDIAKEITQKLYNEDILNATEFCGDIDTVFRLAEEDILHVLSDYLILSGAEIVVG